MCFGNIPSRFLLNRVHLECARAPPSYSCYSSKSTMWTSDLVRIHTPFGAGGFVQRSYLWQKQLPHLRWARFNGCSIYTVLICIRAFLNSDLINSSIFVARNFTLMFYYYICDVLHWTALKLSSAADASHVQGRPYFSTSSSATGAVLEHFLATERYELTPRAELGREFRKIFSPLKITIVRTEETHSIKRSKARDRAWRIDQPSKFIYCTTANFPS